MASLEIITIADVRAASIEPVISTTHGKITPVDISMALSRCRKEAADMARGKYLGNTTARQNTIDYMASWAKNKFRNPPDLHTNDFFELFAEVVVHDFFSANKCFACKGRAKAIIENKLVTCGACAGTSYTPRKISDAARARMLKMSWTSYFYRWRAKYSRAIDLLNIFEDEVIEQFRRV